MSDVSKIADPSTVGLASFGIGLFCLASVVAGLAGTAPMAIIIPLTVFVGVIQFIVGGFGFIKGELFTALAFFGYGLFWITFGIMSTGWFGKPGADIQLAFFLAYTIFTAFILLATLVTNTAVILTIATLLAIFILLDLQIYLNNAVLGTYAGYVGIYTSLNALYITAGSILNTMYGRTVLPMGSSWCKPSNSASC